MDQNYGAMTGSYNGPGLANVPMPPKPFSPIQSGLISAYDVSRALTGRLRGLRDRLYNKGESISGSPKEPPPPSVVEMPSMIQTELEYAHNTLEEIIHALFGA